MSHLCVYLLKFGEKSYMIKHVYIYLHIYAFSGHKYFKYVSFF